MSYVLNAWVAPVPRDMDETVLILKRLSLLPERVDARLDDFIARLHARYPESDDLPHDSADDVWLDNSLALAPHGPILAFGIQSKHIGRVLPFVVEQAAAAGVVVHDDQNGMAFRPDGWVLTLKGRARVEDVMRAPTDDEASHARRVLAGPAPAFAGSTYRLHLFYCSMSDYEYCARHVEWASRQTDPVAVYEAAMVLSRAKSRPYIAWEVGSVHDFKFTKMNHFAQRVNAKLRAQGEPLPWADGHELDEAAPRLMMTLDVRATAIRRAWPLILAEAAQQGLVVHDPLQRLQAMPIGSFKIGDDWYGAGDDGADALQYGNDHAAPRVFALLEPALLALGFTFEPGISERAFTFRRAHGDVDQQLFVYVKESDSGIGVEGSIRVDIDPERVPCLPWVPKADGKPQMLFLHHSILQLLHIETLVPFNVFIKEVRFYREAHIPEFVDTFMQVVRERVMPLLDRLDSVNAIFDLLAAPAAPGLELDYWRKQLPMVAHLADSADAERLLAEEDARLQAWERDPEAPGYPGPVSVKSRRDILTRIRARRDATAG